MWNKKSSRSISPIWFRAQRLAQARLAAAHLGKSGLSSGKYTEKSPTRQEFVGRNRREAVEKLKFAKDLEIERSGEMRTCSLRPQLGTRAEQEDEFFTPNGRNPLKRPD